MKCTTCGAEIPMGSPYCTNCGAAAPAANYQTAAPAQGYQTAAPMGGYAQAPNPNMGFEDQPYVATSPAPTPKKSKTGLIVGIIAGIVAIAAIVAVLVIFVFGGKLDGKYVCDVKKILSEQYGADFDYESLGISMDIYLTIDGDKFDFVMESSFGGETSKEEVKGNCKRDGDTLTLTPTEGGSEAIEAKYDKKEKKITFEEDGMKLEFTKE